jgi:hypothetical protein
MYTEILFYTYMYTGIQLYKISCKAQARRRAGYPVYNNNNKTTMPQTRRINLSDADFKAALVAKVGDEHEHVQYECPGYYDNLHLHMPTICICVHEGGATCDHELESSSCPESDLSKFFGWQVVRLHTILGDSVDMHVASIYEGGLFTNDSWWITVQISHITAFVGMDGTFHSRQPEPEPEPQPRSCGVWPSAP